MLEVRMSVKGWWEENQEQMERPVHIVSKNLREDRNWLDIHADQEYVLQVCLHRITVGQQKVSVPGAPAPLTSSAVSAEALWTRLASAPSLSVCMGAVTALIQL